MAARYSDQQLLNILRDLAAELGRPPTTRELLARDGLPSPVTIISRFGSWPAALEAAELQPRHHPAPPCTDEQLLKALRTLAAELGRSPTSRELLARRDLPSPGACRHHFGSWSAALEAAGLETRQCGPPTYSDERLLAILRHLAAELGRAPTTRELLARPGLPSPATYRAHFGSWRGALRAAGLKLNRQTPATDDREPVTGDQEP